MTTRIFGASDDLIEFDGDFRGEVGFFSEKNAALVICDDGTILSVKYGKPQGAIWSIEEVRAGSLFVGITKCSDENADPYSDVAEFKDGLTGAFVAKEWERAR